MIVDVISGIDPEDARNETERINAMAKARARVHALKGTWASGLVQAWKEHNLSPTDYAFIIGSGILALLVGFFFGLLPMKNDRMTPDQRTWSQVASLIGIGLVVVLILIGQDVASWVAIGALVAGILIGIIPAIKQPMQARFGWLQPLQESDRVKPNKGNSPKKKSTQSTSSRRNSSKSRKASGKD